MDAWKNIILTGFMGTGKTSVGRLVAERLKLRFLDTDGEIEKRSGMSAPDIFRVHGEAHFRTLEKELCREIASQHGLVIATGGGMPVDPENRRLLNASGIVIRLKCRAEEIVRRVVENDGERPLLRDEDPILRVDRLLREREPAYAVFPFHIDTTRLAIVEVAQRVTEIALRFGDLPGLLAVRGPGGGGYTITIGPGLLDRLGMMLQDRDFTPRLAVVTDSHVGPLYLERVMQSLERAGFKPFARVVPAGERSKDLRQVETLYQVFLKAGLDRRAAVVALGGGVIGDLTGYAAATYMRGVALIHCPTTFLAMVDSSVGGKTGVDLHQGKNLVGAFKQPVLVAADTGTLASLPATELRGGMAELIKHAVIDDPELFALLEDSDGPPVLDPELITRSVKVKINVVENDPYESGRREVLNLGHTVGHALEKCSGFSCSHGDAVAVGMLAAARISGRIGLSSPQVGERLETLLTRIGLPVRHRMDADEIVGAMTSDKKSRDGALRLVLIRNVGEVEHGLEVVPDLIRSVLQELSDTRGEYLLVVSVQSPGL